MYDLLARAKKVFLDIKRTDHDGDVTREMEGVTHHEMCPTCPKRGTPFVES
jgi:hypothetical protein